MQHDIWGVFDLRSFSLDDLYRCSAELRGVGLDARDADEAAARIVAYFYEQLCDENREPECRLVRLFRAAPLAWLAPKDALAAKEALGAEVGPTTVCLSLRASRGVESRWNDPKMSRDHRLIPLAGPEYRTPMIGALVDRLGIPAELFSTAPPAFDRERGPFFGVFHVEDARGSPFVPHQDFVERYGIRSVLGFGGPLPRADVFVVILFSRVLISKWTAELFRSLAPSIGLTLLRAGRNHDSLEARLEAYERIVRAHEYVALANLRQRERLLASAEEAREAALAASRTKDEFLAVLGHELRNPLSPIMTALELMKAKGMRSRELEVIERQARHLKRLVDDLLDVERITRGKIELRSEPVELALVVERGVEMTAEHLEARDQRLVVDVPRAGARVCGDVARLAQVVSNLISNASKFSPPGSEVTISAERAGNAMRLRVRDQGVGIEREMLERIFDAFVQRPTVGLPSSGLGLGLAIVRELVELHGGTVTAKSEGRGMGSEFVVELPAFAAAPAAATAPEKPEPLAAAPRKMRVLVVDDNEDAAALLAAALTECGYDVRVAPDGPSALAIAPDFVPEVVLLDIGLPKMDGYEVARRLRSLPVPARMKLVAISGYGQDRDERRSAEAGFAAHLVKPVGLEAVLDVLRAP